jgi:hypothetical protein
MRRVHLRGRENVLKRQLIHVGAFNLSLVLRKMLGAGTPRELRIRQVGLVFVLLRTLVTLLKPSQPSQTLSDLSQRVNSRRSSSERRCRRCQKIGGSATGC